MPIVDTTKNVLIAGLTGGSLNFLALCLCILAKFNGASGQIGLDDMCLLGAVVSDPSAQACHVSSLTHADSEHSIY